jgi:hypothetical protein
MIPAMQGYAKRNSEDFGLKSTQYKFKNDSPQRHRGTEKGMVFINCATGAVNKVKLCASVPLW